MSKSDRSRWVLLSEGDVQTLVRALMLLGSEMQRRADEQPGTPLEVRCRHQKRWATRLAGRIASLSSPVVMATDPRKRAVS